MGFIIFKVLDKVHGLRVRHELKKKGWISTNTENQHTTNHIRERNYLL